MADAQTAAATAGFLPYVARWFGETFAAPSPVQVRAWPAIRRGENALLLAPTGSGKTLAAFLCAIDDLYRRAEAGQLHDAVYVIYVSPLKALGNDIQRNLLRPLAAIRELAGESLPTIRVGVRTGDTTPAERARMLRRPPHILITTPESLYLLLGSTRMAAALRSVGTVIVDEIHSLCESKRGVHLAVTLERLTRHAERPPQRVGCSATISPLEQIAAYLVGSDDGRPRPCTVVDAGARKELDVQAVAPLPDFLEASNTALWASAYERLLQDIARHRTTLVFCNSRYKAERTGLRLTELAGDGLRIGVHHGSMSKETRLTAEQALKAGDLQALVATSSLELGIDVGAIDLVYQLESPKSVAAALQRVGRAGHLLDRTSKGRILVFERDELLEAAVICRAMYASEIDAVHMPRRCLDVLAQQIVGAVAGEDWQADDLFTLVRRAHPYTDLPRESFDAVLAMLAGGEDLAMARPPKPLLLWDRIAGRLTAARSSAHVASMCVGTIAEDSEYEVVIDGSNKRVGTLNSEFVDDSLRGGDVFVLGSSTWKMTGVRKNRLFVAEAPGATPTVPWWTGPIPPRTPEVGRQVGLLRREIASRLGDAGLGPWLQQHYHLDDNAAAALVDYVREQEAVAGLVPDHEQFLVESWRDELGRQNLIVHCPYGQRINRTWGVALAAAAKREFRQDWAVTATNDVLLLGLANDGRHGDRASGPNVLPLASSANLADLVSGAAAQAASSASAFRDAAVVSLQVLRAYKGKRTPFWLQSHRAQELFEAAQDHPEYPVNEEIARSYLEDVLDLAGLTALLRRLEAGEIRLVHRDVESPSPFAHSLLVQDRYRSDHQMGRQRRAHLLRLHRQVLQEVLSSEEMAQLLDARAIERVERRLLYRSESTRVRSSDELAQAIRDLGEVPARMDAIAEMVDGDAAAMLAPLIEQGRLVAFTVPNCDDDPVRLVAADLWQQYRDAYLPAGEAADVVQVPLLRDGTIAGFETVEAAAAIPARFRRPGDVREARRAILDRCLRRRGPVSLYEIANSSGWPMGTIERHLRELEAEGKAAAGIYVSNKPRPQWANRANLEEIHRLTMGYLRRELAACAPHEVVDFLTRWQHRHPATMLGGIDGLRQVIAQLQGIELVQGAYESEVLPARVADYRPDMLDRLIAAGEVCWRRLGVKSVRRGVLTFAIRRDLAWLTAGAPVEFDGEREADADIRAEIVTVHRYFRAHGTAYFD
ncbi:MAG: DEAD/DEAH box helicase, partial [Anaerolineae bacterium]